MLYDLENDPYEKQNLLDGEPSANIQKIRDRLEKLAAGVRGK